MDNRTTATHSPVSGSPFLEANALFQSECWHAASCCVHAPRFRRGGFFADHSLVCAIDPIACVRVRIFLSSLCCASVLGVDVQVDTLKIT